MVGKKTCTIMNFLFKISQFLYIKTNRCQVKLEVKHYFLNKCFYNSCGFYLLSDWLLGNVTISSRFLDIHSDIEY